VLTDGDPDLACYVRELFPDAIHTLDVMHVVEKLWTAGTAVHPEGTPEHHAWAEARKDALHGERVADILAELDDQLGACPPPRRVSGEDAALVHARARAHADPSLPRGGHGPAAVGDACRVQQHVHVLR
jgi:hypothetical protein